MKIKSFVLSIISIIICTAVLPAQDLINAVKSGDIHKVEDLLPYDDMEEKDSNNYTAYHWTAILGYKDIAGLLLENGAEPNNLATDVQYRKLRSGELMWAGDVVGAKSAAVLAEENDNEDLVDYYISQGNVNEGLTAAVNCSNKVVTEKALEAGADPNYIFDMAGNRILLLAVRLSLQSGEDDVVDILLDHKAKPFDAFANSFIYGTEKEDSKVWEKIIDMGIDVNQTYYDRNEGDINLLFFAYNKDFGKLKFLVEHGGDFTMRDSNGRTLLHYCVAQNRPVNVLIPSPEICDKDCMQEYLSIRDNDGNTACDIAQYNLERAEYSTEKNAARNAIALVCDNQVKETLKEQLKAM